MKLKITIYNKRYKYINITLSVIKYIYKLSIAMFLQLLVKCQQRRLMSFVILYCRPKAYTKMF